MTTATKDKAATGTPPAAAEQSGSMTTARPAHVPMIAGPRIPYHPAIEERFGVDKSAWKALVEAIFPLASSIDSVILALSYCKARKLDPFKRNVHIVPIWSKEAGRMVDTVWPGIGELRTTAFRTGCYAGRSECVFGPDIVQKVGNVEMKFPEWAQITVRRITRNPLPTNLIPPGVELGAKGVEELAKALSGTIVDFAGPKVYWIETYSQAGRNDPSPNSMWQKRPRGQLEKCSEAAALRAAFPEEIGNEHCAEEVGSLNVVSATPTRTVNLPDGRSDSDKLADLLEGPSQPVVSPSSDDTLESAEDLEVIEPAAQVEPAASRPASKPATAGDKAPAKSGKARPQSLTIFQPEDLEQQVYATKNLSELEEVEVRIAEQRLTDAWRSKLEQLCASAREQHSSMYEQGN